MALKAWYTFNNNYNNQGCGDAELTVATAPTYVDGKIGKALNQGGFKWTAEQTAKILNNKALTICFWVYIDLDEGSTANRAMFFGNDSMNSAGGRQFSLFNYSTSNDLHWSWQNCINGTYSMVAGGALNNVIPARTWTHIAVTYENPNGTIYINGVQKHTFTGVYNTDSFAFETQVIHNSQYHRFNDYRIYDECLSPKQIKEISKGLVAHYKLDYPDIEPTINLTYGNNYVPAVNTGWGAHRATSTDENLYKTYLPFETGTKVVYTYDTSLGTGGGAGIQNKIKRIAIKPSTQYFYSLYVKPGDDFTYFNENFLYRYEYDSSNTKLTEGGVAKKANLIELEDGWYRIWGTFTTKENTSLAEFWFYSYPSKNITYYIGGCQVEEKDHMTPFVAGERNYYPSDCSGNNYNLIMTGNLIYDENSPRYEGSTTFDGNSLNYFYRNAFDFLTNSLTYNCWVYQTSKTTTSSGASSLLQMIMSQGRDYGNASYGMNIDSYNGIPEVRIGKYGVQNIVIAGTTQLVNEQWHMLTATWDGTTAKLYVDGTLEKTGTVSEVEYTQNSNSFIIGKMAYLHTNPTSYFPFVGSISDVRLYATALSAEDILTMYKTSGIIDNKNNVYAYEFKEE